MDKKLVKEDGIAPSAVNATSPAVAGTAGDITWEKQKKKLRVITRQNPNGTNC